METSFYQVITSDVLPLLALALALFLSTRPKDITLKIILFVFSYPIIHLLYLKSGGEGSRIVGITGLPQYSQHLTTAYWTYIFCFFALFLSLGKAKNETYSIKYEIPATTATFWVFFSAFATFSILAHPWVFGLSGRREQIPLSGAWNALYVSTFVILCLLKQRRNKVHHLFIIGIIPVYLLLSGERVNSILMIVSLYLFYTYKNNNTPLQKNKFAFYASLLIGVGAAFLAGQIREATYSSEAEIFDSFKIFNYTTAIEALHVYMASFWYIETYGFDRSALLGALYSFVPFHPLGGAGSPYFFEKIILNKIQTVGGGIFLSEGILIAGPSGAILLSAAYGLLLRSTFLAKSKWASIIYMLIFVLTFRVTWYGWEYILPPLYTLMFTLFLLKIVSRAR